MAAGAYFRFIPTLVLVALASGTSLAAAGPADDYHAELQTVRTGPFQRLESLDVKAMLGTAPGDARLPDHLSMASPPGRVDASLAKARRLAVQLAAQRGARSLPATASNRWVAERVRTDLSDYLSQAPSPYLCAGLDNYLGTLASYTNQLAVSDLRLDEAEAFLGLSVRENTRVALDAMLPPPTPRYAPADRPGMQLAGPGSLPPIDMQEEQGDGSGLLTLAAATTSAAADGALDDLRPAVVRPALALESRADLERIARRLVFAARRGGYFSLGREAAASGPGLGATSYIAAIAQALPQVSDPLVRPALLNALADIEALDVLMVARNGGQDPVAQALDETMSAIRTAHDITCRAAR